MLPIILKLIFFFYLMLCVNSLTPMNLPNGNNKKYKVNKLSRATDLKVMTHSNIKFIMKHWENNILKTSKEICIEDTYILSKIDIINEYIKHEKNTNIYLSWMPKGVYTDIIFIIICEIIPDEKILQVKYILHSPYWEHKQIKSIHLKYALEDMIRNIDNISLDLSYLYNTDIRYKFDWYDYPNTF